MIVSSNNILQKSSQLLSSWNTPLTSSRPEILLSVSSGIFSHIHNLQDKSTWCFELAGKEYITPLPWSFKRFDLFSVEGGHHLWLPLTYFGNWLQSSILLPFSHYLHFSPNLPFGRKDDSHIQPIFKLLTAKAAYRSMSDIYQQRSLKLLQIFEGICMMMNKVQVISMDKILALFTYVSYMNNCCPLSWIWIR